MYTTSYTCAERNAPFGLPASTKAIAAMPTFEYRMYSKKELALIYYPHSPSPRTAQRNFYKLISGDAYLMNKLEKAGYKKRSKFLSPKVVRILVEELGFPQEYDELNRHPHTF